MAVRDALLTLLEQNAGGYLSGEQIARTLGVTRAAVWKAATALRARGIAIEAATNAGYRLAAGADALTAEGIRARLPADCGMLIVETQRCVTSTNTLLRERAQSGAPEGLVLAASAQTAGRGRRGRSFFSPGDTGLYLSVLLRPSLPAERAIAVTTMAAVAMSEAIEAVSGAETSVKWVNDILLGGKKVCGILTEASLDMEGGGIEYAVLGAGVNVYPPAKGFPSDVAAVAGSVLPAKTPGALDRLAAEYLGRFFRLYRAGANDPAAYTEAYRRRSAAVGRRITVLRPDGAREALCTGVDDRCRLLVTYDDGTSEALSSGEISIRL